MTVANSSGRFDYVGVNTTGPFPFPGRIFQSTDIFVNKILIATGVSTGLFENVDYTVAIADDHGSAVITLTVALTPAYRISIQRNPDYKQDLDLLSNDIFPAESVEQALDEIVMMIQAVRNLQLTCIRTGIDDNTTLLLPPPATRANMYVGFDANGNATVLPASAVAVTDSGNVNFQQAGGIVRTVRDKLREGPNFNVKDFGAKGDNVTDDTVTINAAIQAAIAAGGALFFPVGIYLISGTLTINGALRITGSGRSASSLRWVSGTLNAVNITTDSPVEIFAMGFTAPVGATAGNVISMGSGGTQNAYSSIKDCLFTNGWNGIASANTCGCTIADCYFIGLQAVGVYLANSYVGDFGGNLLRGNYFRLGGANFIGIQVGSSNRAKLVENRFDGGKYAIQMLLVAATAFSDLMILGNTFTSQSTAALAFNTGGGGATAVDIGIVSNRFDNCPTGLAMTDATAFISRVLVCDNWFAIAAGGSSGINLLNVNHFLVQGNLFVGNGGAPAGVIVGAACADGTVGVNKYKALGVAFTNASNTTYLSPPVTIGRTGTDLTVGAVTTEQILATFKLRAGQAGVTGRIITDMQWAMTNSANAKTIRIRLNGIGGTVLFSVILTANASARLSSAIHNRAAANSQVGFGSILTDTAAISAALLTAAQDTTTDLDLVITGQKASAGEVLTMNAAHVELHAG
jgi:hypothetical protein